MLLNRNAQGKEKRSSAPAFGFGPDSPTVPVNDSLHRCQSDSRSFEFVLAMQTLEDTEQFIGILLFESDSVVANENRVLTINRNNADVNGGALLMFREFHRV